MTLEREVDSAEDQAEAVRIARTTEGVTRVEDRLRTDAEPSRDTAARGPEPRAERDTGTAGGVDPSDTWLTAKIQSKYFIDMDVKGRRIDVDTQNGVVDHHEDSGAVLPGRRGEGPSDQRGHERRRRDVEGDG